jgi:6-phospho-beta-glucosidase
MAKFTVLGGSSVAVPELVDTLAPHIHTGRNMEIALHGRDAHKLEVVGKVCQRIAEPVSGLSVTFTTSLEEALTGADFVLNQVRVGGLDSRDYDETFPHPWNIPGEETVGPGGAANAMRTVPVVLELCRTIEKVAPDSILLSFSNPSSVVQRAVSQYTKLKIIGLCNAPCIMHNALANALVVDSAQVDSQYVGMHHFGFITSACVDGVERLPEALAQEGPHKAMGLAPEIGQISGVLPHMYFKYFFHPERMLEKQRKSGVSRARELQQLETELLEVYSQHQGTEKPDALKRRSAVWYDEVVVPALVGLAFGEHKRLAVNITNNGLIDGLADDTIIEISSEIKDGQLYSPKPRQLPPPALFGMLQANALYEHTLVEAIVHDSKDLLLQAFLISPLVPSYEVAREIVDALWPRRGWPAGNV